MCGFDEHWLKLQCPEAASFSILDCACSFKAPETGVFLHMLEAGRKEVL